MTTGMLIFIGLIFVAVFLLAQGLIVPVFGESARTRRLLRQRLRQIEVEQLDAAPTSLVREKYLKELSPFERWLESLPAMQRLATLVEQAGAFDGGASCRAAGRARSRSVAGVVGWSFSRLAGDRLSARRPRRSRSRSSS